MAGRRIAEFRLASRGEAGAGMYPCVVSAQLDESGELTVSVSATGEFRPGSRVGASFDGEEIPEELRNGVRDALQAVLDEAHDTLKAALVREVDRSIDHVEQGIVPDHDEDVQGGLSARKVE